jgi:hypothetical protein
MSLQNINISRKNIILSLAPTKSYDQIQATLNLLFANDLEFDTMDVNFKNYFLFIYIHLKN